MKIKIYIVTYNNKKDLNVTLKSLFASDMTKYNYEINIINNHSNFNIDKEYLDKVNVLHNVLRPNWSTGHLSRNWNQALILGFKDLNNPDCDIVVGCQDDTTFYSHWAKNIIELHKKYTFIAYGWGDNFMSWTPNGVKRIGLWDESFQMVGHTSDYFIRALIYNKKKSSINDYHHKRTLNIEKVKIADRPNIPLKHNLRKRIEAVYGIEMLKHKWGSVNGCSYRLTHWTPELRAKASKIRQKCSSRIMYPYFERNIKTLKEQNYV